MRVGRNKIAPLAELAENIDVARALAAMMRADDRLACRAEDIDVDRARLALMRALIRLSATKSL